MGEAGGGGGQVNKAMMLERRMHRGTNFDPLGARVFAS